MIYLSQLTLNPMSRMVQRELNSPYQLHRTLMQGFTASRDRAKVLHRVDVGRHGELLLLVQSVERPNWQPLLTAGQNGYLLKPPLKPKEVDINLPHGSRYQFRVVANPTVKKRRWNEELGKRHNGKRNSNRVPLVREDKQHEWLCGQGEKGGFRPISVTITQPTHQIDYKKRRDVEGKHRIKVFTVQYDGVLQITDAEKFNRAWREGIGPAKAFGCGLLSLARA